MEKELIEASVSTPPEALSVWISAGSGLLAGILASLFSPWVHWFIERRRKSIEYTIKLISDIRKLIDETDDFEKIKYSSYWGFIASNLTKDEKNCILFC